MSLKILSSAGQSACVHLAM